MFGGGNHNFKSQLQDEKKAAPNDFKRFAADAFEICCHVDSWRCWHTLAQDDMCNGALAAGYAVKADDIRCPVFFFHGELDARTTPAHVAPQLMKKIIEQGAEKAGRTPPLLEIEIVPGVAHSFLFGPNEGTVKRISSCIGRPCAKWVF